MKTLYKLQCIDRIHEKKTLFDLLVISTSKSHCFILSNENEKRIDKFTLFTDLKGCERFIEGNYNNLKFAGSQIIEKQVLS